MESLPGWDCVGYSYNVFDFYANPRSVGQQLFDLSGSEEKISFNDRSWRLSKDIAHRAIFDTTKKTVCVRTKDTYSLELGASAKVSGSYGLFSASVEADCRAGQSAERDSTYTSMMVIVHKWKLSLRDNIETLQSKMKPAFRSALHTMEPMELFDKYGTYYLSEVLVGGRANYNATTVTSEFASDIEIKVAAEAAYSSLVSGRVSADMKEKVSRFTNKSTTHMYAIGGSSLADIKDKEDFSSWLKSIDGTPMFCGFTENSLVPLWRLASTLERRDILRAATETYVPATLKRLAIVGVQVIESSNDKVNPPIGYVKIDYDLNKGAGGSYIYLCYRQEKISARRSTADPMPITSFEVIAGSSANISPPNGYRIIGVDLNSGAGGKYIYLCYSQLPEKAVGGLPVRSVTIIGGEKNKDIVTPYGFERIGVDLNWEAKGDFIYFCYSRHLD